jgi:hypothetical protein
LGFDIISGNTLVIKSIVVDPATTMPSYMDLERLQTVTFPAAMKYTFKPGNLC